MHWLALGRWAWLPLPVLLAAMGIVWAANRQGSHESVYVLFILSLVFSLLVGLVVAYVIARSFLVRGTPGLLLLGCGVVIWGSAGVVATIVAHDDVNIRITIYNSCVWLSGLCHLAGGALSLRSRRSLAWPALWLLAGYAQAAAAVALVTLLALTGWMPTFFVDGRGGTPVRQVVLIWAIAMFVLTAGLLGVTRRGTPNALGRAGEARQLTSVFACWYALALLLIAAGLLGVTLPSSHAGILDWMGRATQALGGLYMLIAAVASMRESRAWGVTLEAALRESEEHYRTLFETAPDAIVVHREGRFLHANEAALRLAGVSSFQELAGHNVLDFVPPEERERVLERTRGVMAGRRPPMRESMLLRLDGQPVAVEFHTVPVDFRGARAVQTIIRDITRRWQAEKALRELNAALERKVAERTAELEHRARQLQKLTFELSQAQERESKRVAEILREDLPQRIAGAKLQVDLLNSRSQDDPSRQLTAVQIHQILKDAIAMSRSLSHELSPGVFYDNDLGEALEWLGERVGVRHGMAVHVEVCGEGTLQSEGLTVFLFRATRELLANVVRHAGVNEAAIRLRRMGRYMTLRVSDRGRGFDPRELKETSGFGLLSIRERVELLGGRVKIASVKAQGTKVRIVVPDSSENRG